MNDATKLCVQAILLGLFVAADGAVAVALGAPSWLGILYLLFGIALAAGWIALGRQRRPPSSAPSEEPPAAAATPAEAPPPEDAADARLSLAVGYVHLHGRADGEQLAVESDAIQAWCSARGLALSTVVHDVDADGDGRDRPWLRWALEHLASGHAQWLIVPRLRYLSSNLADLPPLLCWFCEPPRALVAMDFEIDTSTEAGRLAASVVAGVGDWERDRLATVTPREPEARPRGGGQGRAAVADVPELQDRIAAMRRDGMTLQAIADRLNAEGVPTLRGGAKWRPSSVQRATGYRRPSSPPGLELRKPTPEREA